MNTSLGLFGFFFSAGSTLPIKILMTNISEM